MNDSKTLTFQDKKVLQDARSITQTQMEARTRKIYAAFDQRRKTVEAKEADRLDAEELRQLEEKIKRKKP